MKIKEDVVMWALTVIAVLVLYAIFVSDAQGASPHHDHDDTPAPAPQPVIIYVEQPVADAADDYSADDQVNVTELVNTTNIENYSPNDCQGVAIAMAGANNHLYMTKKPQMSIGVGECNGEFASSLMFGMRVNNQLLLNGNWATDESVNAFGIGATVIFK